MRLGYFAVLLGSLLSAQTMIAAPTLSTVVDSATLQNTTLAPGGLGTIFGSGLALATAYAPGYPLPTYLGNATVYVNGLETPLLYVSPSQVNFELPWSARVGTATVVMIVNNAVSNVLTVQVSAVAPALFSSVVSSAFAQPATAAGRLAHPGEYITLYATGLGNSLDVPIADGMSPPDDNTVANLKTKPTVTIAGMPATVAFAGLAPPGMNGFYSAGVYQLSVLVPANITAGDSLPVQLSMNNVSSNTVTMSIAQNSPGASVPSIAKFLTLAPTGTVARLITSLNTCPSVTLDGKQVPMTTRAAASLPFYPILTCELPIPDATQSLVMDGQTMLLPVKSPSRITVLGDTGCRMDNTTSQACLSATAWPVALINKNAATTNPQLLIHDGDYHYREYPCMNTGCLNSPWGYNWDVWREDQFKPFQTLLAAAPWVFVRGNHETCDRAGEGWFRFLDPRPYPASCQTYTDPYLIDIGSIQFIHVDSAVADDAILYPDQIAAYQPMFDKVRQMATSKTWILTHRPIWAIRSNLNSNVVMQAASNNNIPVQMILSGHTHTFQAYTFSPLRAPQLIIGNSGDNIAAVPAIPIQGQTVGNATVTLGYSIGGYGYSTVMPTSDGGWSIIPYDVNGVQTDSCKMTPASSVSASITCDK